MASNKISFKQFLDKPEPYYVVDIHWNHWNSDIEQSVSEVLTEQSTGWYYSSGGFHAFENPEDCDLVKGVLSWRTLEKAI